MLILALLLFVMGPPYLDPPTEYGVAVNFGTTDFGSGNVQPKKPIKSEPKEINKRTEETPTESIPEEAVADKVEDVVTQESEESIKIKKQKKAEAKAKVEVERVEREKREAEERKRKEQEEKKKKLDELMGGIGKSDGEETGSEGNDNQVGDKGQPDGDPYAPYTGNPGTGAGGMGYGLNGRAKPQFKIFKGCENEFGLVVVDIVVNQKGDVIKATPGVRGTTNTNSCLKDLAKKIAVSYKWPADYNAPTRQFGKVSINFKQGQ